MVNGVPSNMNFIGRLEMVQSYIYSHKTVELSSFKIVYIIFFIQTFKKKTSWLQTIFDLHCMTFKIRLRSKFLLIHINIILVVSFSALR